MGAHQKIRIGDIIIESKELPWEIIKDLATSIKKVARWNPDTKEWKLTWRIFPNIKIFLEHINKKIIKVDQEYAYKLLDAIEKIIDDTPKIIVDEDNDKVYVLSLAMDPYITIRSVDPAKLPMNVVVKRINIEDIGEVEAPYIAISKSRVEELIARGEEHILPQELQKAISEVYPHKIQVGISANVTPQNRIRLKLPKTISRALIEDLKSLATIEYYISTAEGTEKKVIAAYRIYERKSYIDIYLPAFTAGFIEDIAEKYGIDITVDYNLPEKNLKELKENFKLYKHQAEALDRWLRNKYKGTIVIPTGGGKTLIGIAAITRIKKPTIILVPNLWLLDQWRERISTFTGISKYSIGILGGGKKEIKDITVSTYQSAIKNIDTLAGRFWLAIYDECHHIPARTFRRVAMNLRVPYKMALSATPKRSDKNEILLFKLVGNIVYSTTYAQLVKMGIVAPMVYRRIYVPMPQDRILLYFKAEREADREKDELKKKQLINRLISIAQENPVKIDVIKRIVEKHKEDKIFIFAPSIKFAKMISKEINGIVPAAALTAEESKSEAEKIIRRFKSCTLQVLVIIKKAEEGVDIGEANVAIIVGGSKQEREFVQRVGRVLRFGENKVAWVYELVSEGTVEEAMAKKRGGLKLVGSIAGYVKKKFGLDAIREITWRLNKDLE